MSRVGIGASAAPAEARSIAVAGLTTLHAAVACGRFDRDPNTAFRADDVDATRQARQRAAKAWEEGRFKNSLIPVKTSRLTILAKTNTCRLVDDV